jgi:hypothetical protein
MDVLVALSGREGSALIRHMGWGEGAVGDYDREV